MEGLPSSMAPLEDIPVPRMQYLLEALGIQNYIRDKTLEIFDAKAPPRPPPPLHNLQRPRSAPLRPQSVPLGCRVRPPPPTRRYVTPVPHPDGQPRETTPRTPSRTLHLPKGPFPLIQLPKREGYEPSTSYYPRKEPNLLPRDQLQRLTERLSTPRPVLRPQPPVQSKAVRRSQQSIDQWVNRQQLRQKRAVEKK